MNVQATNANTIGARRGAGGVTKPEIDRFSGDVHVLERAGNRHNGAKGGLNGSHAVCMPHASATAHAESNAMRGVPLKNYYLAKS